MSKVAQPSSSGWLNRKTLTYGTMAIVVIAAIVAYWAFASILGIVAFLIKTVVVIAIIGGVLYLVMRHAGRRKL